MDPQLGNVQEEDCALARHLISQRRDCRHREEPGVGAADQWRALQSRAERRKCGIIPDRAAHMPIPAPKHRGS